MEATVSGRQVVAFGLIRDVELRLCPLEVNEVLDVALAVAVIRRSAGIKRQAMMGKATKLDGRLPPIAHVSGRCTVRAPALYATLYGTGHCTLLALYVRPNVQY